VGIDLIILCLIGFFALLGAISGAARQLGQLIAILVAYPVARALGPALGPWAARKLESSTSIGVVAATLVLFIMVLVLVRYAVTHFFRRLFAGKNIEDRTIDRGLGFVFGAAKVGFIAYVMLSGLVFVEQNVAVAGRKVGMTPKSSIAFGVARQYNLFEMGYFAPVKDLMAVSKAMGDPKQAERLRSDPAFQALTTDPRFQQALKDDKLKEALASGDYRQLLQSEAVMKLIGDPTLAARLDAAAEVTQ
jgi:membrane protein required for colicin V production